MLSVARRGRTHGTPQERGPASACAPAHLAAPLLAILLFLWTACTAHATHKDAALQALDSITASYNDGEWNETLRRLHSFLYRFDTDRNADEGRHVAYAYLMLGNTHLGFADYISAEKYYSLGLKKAEKWGLDNDAMKLCANLAAVSCYLDNRAEAERYLSRLASLSGADPDLRQVNRLMIRALIERTFGNWRKSVVILRQSIAEVKRRGVSEKRLVTPYSEITEIYEQHAMPDSALAYLAVYEQLARKHNMSNMLVDVQRLYSRVYTRLGDADKALRYQERYTTMRDSLLNDRLYRSSTGSFERRSRLKTDRTISDMRFTITAQQLGLFAAGIALLLSLVYMAVIIAQERRLDNSYRNLYAKNEDLMRLSEQQPSADDSSAVERNATPETLKLAARLSEIMQSTEEWRNPEFSLNRLAALAESNTRYVSQAINDTFGCNFRSFINQYRVKEAMRRITDGAYDNLTIQAIGESVGFMSRSNFIAAFKKQTGLTPSVYRRMAGEKAR